MSRHDEQHAAPESPRVEARPVAAGHDWTIDPDQSVAVLLCAFRLCDWHSQDTRTLGPAEQDAVVRWHMLDEHRTELLTLGQLAGAPDGVCARPHPSSEGRYCLDPRGHTGSHGDGRVDRWVLR